MAEEAPGRLTITSPRGTRRVRSLSIDGLEIRRTSIDALRIASIQDGDTLEEREVANLLEDAEPQAAMNRALRILGHRERSTAELTDRLSEDGYTRPVIESVLAKLAEYGYLDDARFAEDYARAKRASGWGRRRIAAGLAEKGILPDMSGPVLDAHLPQSNEIERACESVKTLDLTDRKGRARALRRLVSRGFSYEVARAALDRLKGDAQDIR
ncbi:MAG: regulatory protein RecX [Anaerosomatales bacterium]|nr:regulatory protein RecX [Anaerosomatales bacterium]MDT8433358.1 regulatory protein RecX [Anaerosomatales bacterium]